MEILVNEYGVRYFNHPITHDELKYVGEYTNHDGRLMKVYVPTLFYPYRVTEFPCFIITDGKLVYYIELLETKQPDNSPEKLSSKDVESMMEFLDPFEEESDHPKNWVKILSLWNQNLSLGMDNIYPVKENSYVPDYSWITNFEDKYDLNFLGYDEEGNRLTKDNVCEF